jgi:hypothetical protein
LNQTPLVYTEKLKQSKDYDDSDKKFEAPKKIKIVKKEEGALKMAMMSQS